MSDAQLATLVALGALHGLNPAMGWLFSVYRGLHARSQRALLRTVPPIALGHAASIAAVLAFVEAGRDELAGGTLRLAAGGLVCVFAVWKLVSARAHPRWVGLRLRDHELAGWSFLMSTAHGAGLMLLPVVAAGSAGATLGARGGDVALAAAVHTVAMTGVLCAVAIVVYRTLGVAFLRSAWINVDRLWAVALLGAGAVVVLGG